MSSSRKSARSARKTAKTEKANPHTTGPRDQAVGKAAPAPAPAKGKKATRTRERGVGLKHHPQNKNIPRKAIIQRPDKAETSGLVDASPKVIGNKSLLVFDVMQSRPVEVFLIEALGLNKDADNRLIFVQGDVSNGLMPASVARSKFAIDPNGTALYNARGFDDAAAAKFDMLDIAELIESQN